MIARVVERTGRGARDVAKMSTVLSDAARAQSANLDAAARDVRVGVQSLLLLAHSDSVMRRLHAGEGSLGLFLTDSSVYRQTDSLLTQLRRLVADVQSNPWKYLRVSVF